MLEGVEAFMTQQLFDVIHVGAAAEHLRGATAAKGVRRYMDAILDEEKERRADSFPFLGLYVCGDCGGAITGEKQKGHHYYRCTKKKGCCSLKCIREEVFADELSEQGYPMTRRDEGVSAVSSIFDQWETEERAESTTALNREQTRIADLDARLKRQSARVAGSRGTRADRRAVECSARRLRRTRRPVESESRRRFRPGLQLPANQRKIESGQFPAVVVSVSRIVGLA